jgi:hypothetical protein
MQQRQLRLGDILDDYCPRERRVTNHAVVAMIEDEVRQTRCTTCDAEHAYKGAKVPVRRKKAESGGVLYKQVLKKMPEPVEDDPPNGVPSEDVGEIPAAVAAPVPASTSPSTDPQPDTQPTESETVPEPEPQHDGPVHRPLIRATLPRPEGQAPGRPNPEFTIRQNAGRNGNFRGQGGMRGPRSSGQGGPGRFGKPGRPGRPGQFSPVAGPRSGRHARPQMRHGKKRSK